MKVAFHSFRYNFSCRVLILILWRLAESSDHSDSEFKCLVSLFRKWLKLLLDKVFRCVCVSHYFPWLESAKKFCLHNYWKKNINIICLTIYGIQEHLLLKNLPVCIKLLCKVYSQCFHVFMKTSHNSRTKFGPMFLPTTGYIYCCYIMCMDCLNCRYHETVTFYV